MPDWQYNYKAMPTAGKKHSPFPMPLYEDPPEPALPAPKPPVAAPDVVARTAPTAMSPAGQPRPERAPPALQPEPILEGVGAALGLPQAGLMPEEAAALRPPAPAWPPAPWTSKGAPKKRHRKGVAFKRPKVEPVSPQAIVDLAQAYPAGEARAFFAALYLTGGRVSEVLGLRVKDVSIRPIDGTNFVSFKLITLKRGDYPVRPVDVLPTFPAFKALLVPLMAWVNEKRTEGKVDARLFRYSRRNAREVIHRYGLVKNAMAKIMVDGRQERVSLPEFRVHPHWLRRCSNTHLVEEFGFTESELTARSMWASPATAAGYVQLNPNHLAIKQMRAMSARTA